VSGCPDAPRPPADPSPCAGCFRERLDRWCRDPKYAWLQTVLDFDYSIQTRTPLWVQPNYFEFLVLRILTEERERYREEQMEKKSRQHGG
jgi:hypothetical protein